MNKRTITRTLISATALISFTVACGKSANDQAKDALKDAGIEVPDAGKLPSGFPTDVPTPSLKLENAVGAAGNFTLRYTSADAKADMATYRTALTGAGFTIANDADDLAGPGKNVVFMASKGTTTVIASAFGPDAPGGGNYLGMVVTSS